MQCPSCQAQVDDGQKFCPRCGGALPHDHAAAAQAPGPSEDSASDLSLIGTVLNGKYKVVRLLGEGGMGAVFLGEQQLGSKTRNVAIKTLHAHLSQDAKILARFEREVGTVSELEHPNTIQVFDYGKNENGILYIVMEYVQGRSLADLLEKEGALEPARAEKILSQVCGSLEEAHGRGIVHRDLKPDNIVLTERAGQKDWVKVLDFGIAKRSNEEDKNEQKLTQQGMVLGTPPYMSPEQFTGKPIDARSDIYSLGVMAYEMLTGRLPFMANTAWEWATQHMTVPPLDIDQAPHHERLPERMKAALRKALAKRPEERFPSVRAFLDAFTAGAPPAVVPAGALGSAAGVSGRGKTEVGAPIDFGGPPPGAYGAPPGAGAPAQANWGTPAAGNVAFPTPGAGIPSPPARDNGGKGKTGMLLGVAGVVALVSVGAIVFAMRGSSSSSSSAPAMTVDTSQASAPPVAVLPAFDAGAAAATAAEVETAARDIPALQTGPAVAAHGPAPAAGHKPPTAAPGTKTPGPGATPPATTPPVATPPPAVTTPPPPAEPLECMKARAMKAAGQLGLANTLAGQCIAKGGHL